ncbi:Hypothetical protein A7982_07608 [Minicystis rosea]|nr:Hypothetical protein A7982_07608 [Minicystis rosea]
MAAVMVVAAGMMTAAGCNTSIEVGTGCPGAVPERDAACSNSGDACAYQDGPCAMTFTCDATAHTWQIQSSVCQPAAVDCWAASEGDVCANPGESCGEGGECGGGFFNDCGDDHLWHTSYADGGDCCWEENTCSGQAPYEGQPCIACDPVTCEYPSDCSLSVLSATCGPDGVWHLSVEDDCPPPPPFDCANLDTQEACISQSGCRWLVPGCGEPALPEAGCFASTDCTPSDDACGPGESCQEVVFNPCWDSNCDACGAPAHVCL